MYSVIFASVSSPAKVMYQDNAQNKHNLLVSASTCIVILCVNMLMCLLAYSPTRLRSFLNLRIKSTVFVHAAVLIGELNSSDFNDRQY